MNALLITLFAISLLASFVLSGMEAGFLAINRLRIRQLARKGHRRAGQLYDSLQKPEYFLWTILVGNTLANFMVTSLLVVFLIRRFEDQPEWFWPTFGGCVLLLYAGCEFLPKMLFRAFPNRLTLFFAPLYRLLVATLWPLVGLLLWLAGSLLRWTGSPSFSGSLFGNRDELRSLVRESTGCLSAEEQAMIQRVLVLQSLRVGHLTIPMSQVTTTTTTTPMREVLALSREKKLNRLPVCHAQSSSRHVAGIIGLRALFYRGPVDPEKPAEHYLKPALYLSEDTPVEAAFARLRRSGERMAIVLAADKREIGIITLQDILKVIVGEVSI